MVLGGQGPLAPVRAGSCVPAHCGGVLSTPPQESPARSAGGTGREGNCPGRSLPVPPLRGRSPGSTQRRGPAALPPSGRGAGLGLAPADAARLREAAAVKPGRQVGMGSSMAGSSLRVRRCCAAERRVAWPVCVEAVRTARAMSRKYSKYLSGCGSSVMKRSRRCSSVNQTRRCWRWLNSKYTAHKRKYYIFNHKMSN